MLRSAPIAHGRRLWYIHLSQQNRSTRIRVVTAVSYLFHVKASSTPTMFDRSKYPSKYAPTADKLVKRWTRELPSGVEIESFFLNELCESSEHEYFLAVSDLFLDVVSRQTGEKQSYSLTILYSRLLDAAEFARGVTDVELVEHFKIAVQGFSKLYSEIARFGDSDPNNDRRRVRIGSLVLQAIVMDDLPLARLISHHERELSCTNPDCDHRSETRCPRCAKTITPYEFHRRFHNMRNVPGHPSH